MIHTNIVQIYEVGHLDGTHYIAQEYVAGENLGQRINRLGPIDATTAVQILAQVASALDQADRRRIVHRDIKPENVMLSTTGEVKVADFGLARATDDGQAPNLTQVGITMGTPLYMSPEQVEGKPLDSRSDIYSLGVTTYHMLTGQAPFEGDTALSVAVQHLRKLPKRLENLREDLPQGLCRIVHRMLAKDPEERYANPRHLLEDIDSLKVEGVETTGQKSWRVEPSDDSLASQSRTAATQRLATVMASEGALRPGSNVSRIVLASALAVVIGVTAGWMLREPYLLDSTGGPGIQRQQDALSQWLYASTIGTEAAWQSVLDYYPDDELFVRRANQQLARLYLNELDYEKAMEKFNELAALGDDQPEFQAFGLAGQAIALSLQGRHDQSAQVMSRLWTRRDRLEDPEIREMLRAATAENRRALEAQDPRLAEQLQRWQDHLNEPTEEGTP
jgi:serine/threonine-protein kinase